MKKNERIVTDVAHRRYKSKTRSQMYESLNVRPNDLIRQQFLEPADQKFVNKHKNLRELFFCNKLKYTKRSTRIWKNKHGGKEKGEDKPCKQLRCLLSCFPTSPPIISILYALYCIKYRERNINLVSSNTYYIHHKHTAFNGDAVNQKCTVGGEKFFHLLLYLFHW
jgi:hypothetical protein